MCPHATGDSTPNDANDLVLVNEQDGHKGTNGVNGVKAKQTTTKPHNPYAPRYADFLSNVSNFSVIESTLRGACL